MSSRREVVIRILALLQRKTLIETKNRTLKCLKLHYLTVQMLIPRGQPGGGGLGAGGIDGCIKSHKSLQKIHPFSPFLSETFTFASLCQRS